MSERNDFLVSEDNVVSSQAGSPLSRFQCEIPSTMLSPWWHGLREISSKAPTRYGPDIAGLKSTTPM
jgi:hypothetical protein